jgi:hypothetical protein
MTTEKQKLIQSLLEMQRKFIACEHENGINVRDYFNPDSDHPLAGYASEYRDKTNQLVDMAHQEKDSRR